MTSLDGLSVLVAGASGGLGAPITELLAAEGARLTLVARHQDRLAAIAPPGAAVCAADVREELECRRAVRAAIENHGQLDGVVFAAGLVAFGNAGDVEEQHLQELFAANTFAPIRLLTEARPHLYSSAQAGRPAFAVHLSAVVAEAPTVGMAAYTASKAALTAWDAVAAREMRRRGVRVVDARPPHTETGLAGRPIAGRAPDLPTGKDPKAVAARIVQAITGDERDLPAAAFADC